MGALAEAEIAAAAIRLGIGVLRPWSDGERYDLVFDLRPKLARVQCKTAVLKGSVLKIPCYSARRCASGFVRRYYCASEVDAIAAYNGDLDRCFFIPLAEIPGRTYLHLRLEPCRNGQRLGVNWADEFAFEAKLMGLLGP